MDFSSLHPMVVVVLILLAIALVIWIVRAVR